MGDKMVSISAMITAMMAVIIAVVELRTNRKFQRLSVEPYLELFNNLSEDGYERVLVNSGLGPARIKTVDVRIGSKTISSWKEAVEILTGDIDTRVAFGSLWYGRQVRAEETMELVHLTEKETAITFFQNVSKMNMEICYCSIYDDCWLKEDEKIPEPIDKCSTAGRKSFPF